MQMLELNMMMDLVFKTSLLPLGKVSHPAQGWHWVLFHSRVLSLYYIYQRNTKGERLRAACFLPSKQVTGNRSTQNCVPQPCLYLRRNNIKNKSASVWIYLELDYGGGGKKGVKVHLVSWQEWACSSCSHHFSSRKWDKSWHAVKCNCTHPKTAVELLYKTWSLSFYTRVLIL